MTKNTGEKSSREKLARVGGGMELYTEKESIFRIFCMASVRG